jgi:hypothetical protein
MKLQTNESTRILKPNPGPQEMFLSTSADIAGYGGSAGGGKTFGLLLEALRWKELPHFPTLILRREIAMTKQLGGIWQEAHQLLSETTTVNLSERFFQFPSGARIQMSGIKAESDVHKYQGAQLPHILFDELTHFTEYQFWYMWSRCRSGQFPVKPYMRATFNPQRTGWVKRLFAPWVDSSWPEEDKAQSGEIRWFIRENDQICWVPEGTENAISITFIRAKLSDNPQLMERDPGYLQKLMSLPEKERRELLDGDWDARPPNLVLDQFDPARHEVSWFQIPSHWRRFVGADFGSINTAAVAVAEDPETGNLYVYGEDWPGRSRSFSEIAAGMREIVGGTPSNGAGGNRTGEQGWRQALRAEGMPMVEPKAEHQAAALQYQCVNSAFAANELFIMDSCPKLLGMIESLKRDVDGDGLPLDTFKDTAFHLCAALRYIVTHLKPPKATSWWLNLGEAGVA